MAGLTVAITNVCEMPPILSFKSYVSLEQINIPHYLSKEFKSQSLHDKSRRNEQFRIYKREREYAIQNGKGMKSKGLYEAVLEAEAKKKQKIDPEVNENQTQKRSELKTPISLIKSDQDSQTNPNKDLNYIFSYYNIPHKSLSPPPQQYTSSLSLEETLAILRTISPVDPQGYKEKEPELKQPKLQQYAGLIDVIEMFHEIMKRIIEEEKKNPNVMISRQYKEYLNKDGPAFFYPTENCRSTPISRPKDLNISEE
ncbi:MAG: hypothetical protein EZS28_008887 [Streblomastix strix]|uniref:Uncharacterized protein n=1 Tax=Streblomastix strix TaxID=222440 RepID=A0A5J4WL56_9EUKA|nr:MAG: hypothetical protein EZS28_008887 [Streblomastix strix]